MHMVHPVLNDVWVTKAESWLQVAQAQKVGDIGQSEAEAGAKVCAPRHTAVLDVHLQRRIHNLTLRC